MAKSKKHTKLREWQERTKAGIGVCTKCKRTDHLTVDHIIPMSFLDQLFPSKEIQFEDEDNFDVLCRWCNTFKANKIDHLNPKTIPLLKKYIGLYEEATKQK